VQDKVDTLQPSRAALLYNPATKSNGQLAATLFADTGQPMTAFDHFSGSPLAVSAGVLTHTPAATPSAGYLQANLGARVRRFGAMVSWPLNALGVAAFVLPSAVWTNADITPPAGFHLSVNGNGVWSLIRFSTLGSTTIATHNTHGRFESTIWGSGLKPIDIWISPEDQKAVITWPDGTASTISSAFFASETSNYAIWECFETTGSDVAPSFGALWADTAPTTPDIAALTAYRAAGRIPPNAATNVSGAVSLNSTQATVFQITLIGNITSFGLSADLTQQVAGREFEVHFIQDGTGSRTLAGVSSTIKFAGAATPTLTTTASRRDIFRFRWIGGTYYEISRAMNVG
jgi:hypothetical protein